MYLEKNNNMKISKRRLARELAMQAIYQLSITNKSFIEIREEIISYNQEYVFDEKYFHTITAGIIKNLSYIDEIIVQNIDRKLDELDPITTSLLRIGVFEITLSEENIPYKVAINEAIEVAKKFGAQDSHKFINGVLDKIQNKLIHEQDS